MTQTQVNSQVNLISFIEMQALSHPSHWMQKGKYTWFGSWQHFASHPKEPFSSNKPASESQVFSVCLDGPVRLKEAVIWDNDAVSSAVLSLTGRHLDTPRGKESSASGCVTSARKQLSVSMRCILRGSTTDVTLSSRMWQSSLRNSEDFHGQDPGQRPHGGTLT